MITGEASGKTRDLVPEDILKDPYVLEFLQLAPHSSCTEKDLETALIDQLQSFLLELGNGFSFVARYSVLADHQQLFASKYQPILPFEEELARELEKELANIERGTLRFRTRCADGCVRA